MSDSSPTSSISGELGRREVGCKEIILRWASSDRILWVLNLNLGCVLESPGSFKISQDPGQLNKNLWGNQYFSKKLPRWSQSAANTENHCYENICFPPSKTDQDKVFHQFLRVKNYWVLFSSNSHPSIRLSICLFVHLCITYFIASLLCARHSAGCLC